MNVIGFDHLVLRTGDVERLLEFYTGTLGLAPERVDQWRAGEVPFPSARIGPTALIDFVHADAPPRDRNVDHFCLVVEPTDWPAEIAAGLETTAGPAPRSGAQGEGTSVYLRDPDGNEIELRYYPV